MKNKAFTLIELLAVIVILAIIAIIATPLVLKTIKQSEKSAALISANNYKKAIEREVLKEIKNGIKVDGEYTVQSDGNLCKGSNNTNCEEPIKINMSGSKPIGGKIVIKKGKISKIGTYVNVDKEYSVAYKDGELEVKTWLLTEDFDANGNADIGDLITIGTESFYVYSNDGNEIKALAQYNLNVGNECLGTWNQTPMENTTGLQDSKMLGYKSGTGNVWHGVVEFSKSSNVYNDSEIKKHVDEYAKKLKKLGATNITTRLITANELIELGCSAVSNTCKTDSINSQNRKFVYSASYWTETPIDSNYVKYVATPGTFAKEKYTAPNYVGVRPVVILSASEI